MDGIESPFIKGTKATPEDIGIFLWTLSPEFSTNEKQRNKFIKKVAKVSFVESVKGITELVEKTFQDADVDNSDEKGYANFTTYLIDLFAREYHWSIKDIMDLPLRVCYQLITAIQERCSLMNGDSYSKLRSIDELINKHILNEHKNNSEWHSQNT